MREEDSAPMDPSEERIVELVRALCDVERELQELTGGEVDSVSVEGGKTYLLFEAQEKLRESEEAQRRLAETHGAILNALPAHIALIDSKGVILEVNQSWRQFGTANGMQGPDFCAGRNYLEECERATGDCAEEARAGAKGIRRVLNGKLKDFALEYPCHSAKAQRWFRLTVTPVRPDCNAGAVVMHIDVTERRQAVEALRTTMEEFRTLAEAMPQIVWMARADGWSTYFNQHWMDYTGLTLNESLGDGWSKAFHPEDRTGAWDAWQKARATKGDFTIESRLRRGDGEYRWWLIRGVPQKEARGKVLKWFGTFTDIHDLKLAELEISRANRALAMRSACNERLIRTQQEQELLEAICGIAVETGGYRMAWVGYARDDETSPIEPMASAGAEDGYLEEINLSWSEDEPMGQGPAGQAVRSGQATVCEDMEGDPFFSSRLELALRRGYRGVICLPLRNRERTFGLLALYTGKVLKIGKEELDLLVELADNLAFGLEHIRTNAQVQEQAALLNATTDAIVLRSIDHRVLFWNQGAERMYGWRAADVLGGDVREILMSSVERFDEAMGLVMEKGSWAGELSTHSKEGRKIIADARWTLLRDEEGQPKAVLAINSDITERKKLESQLMRVQRMESIGTLAGGIAHDLNNALSPILMGAAALKYEVASELGQQILSTMEASAQHGADLVRQVLSFARGLEGERIPVNLVHLLNEIQDMIRDTFPKNIELAFFPGRNVWKVIGDATQLHQVFTNLCVNARDAMPNGGLLKVSVENAVLDEVYAGLNPDSQAGAYVQVRVEDTGSGIPPDIRDRIFEPFFTTKEIGKGTGLGLSTTLGIVKNHGGFINLYSEMGKGTIFKVYLPADTKATAPESVAKRQAELPRGNGELILLVDDERAVRTVAQNTLERFGYRVLLAANGAEGVALYVQHREQIGIVLTDMAMPVMDGPSMIIALKTLNPAVKIIGSSGMASHGEVAKAAGAGVKYFVPKPYTAETLLKILSEALREEA
jgi:PAS domain S-box-containing protein